MYASETRTLLRDIVKFDKILSLQIWTI